MSSTSSTFPTFVVAIETHRHRSVGPILRCASAFGTNELYVVGSNHYSTHGAHGAQNHMKVWHFFYWKDCLDFIRNRYGYEIAIYSISPFKIISDNNPAARKTVSEDFGIETLPSIIEAIADNNRCICSKSIELIDFASQPTHHGCFLIGEKGGLTLELMQCCDEVVHVEFPGMTEDQERAIGYESKIALCLQEFCIAKNFLLRGKDENMEKHIVAPIDKDHVKTIRYSQMALKSSLPPVGEYVLEDVESPDTVSLSNIFLTT